MKTITVNNFGGGMASDIYSGEFGEFSTTRNFDILSYPKRLQPLASMEADTASTGIGNIIVGSDGVPYAVGVNGSGGVELYKNTAGNAWTAIAGTTVAGDPSPEYGFLLDYRKVGANSAAPDNSAGAKFIVYANNASTNTIICSDASGNCHVIGDLPHVAGSVIGFVHPKDQILYIAYKASATTTYIRTYDGSTFSGVIFTLPAQYTTTGLTYYGDYLAIACSIASPTNNSSVVFLWDRNTSNSLPNESIPWGEDYLQVLNNLDGVLVGISSYQSDDDATLAIKGYAGGQVEPIKLIPVQKQTTTSPTLTINPRVNFIHRNRLFFSADLVGGSTSPSHKGLWSVGKSKSGQWAVTIERSASTTGSDVSVIAAAFKLDYLYAVHTANGTLTYNGSLSTALSTRFASPSTYESVVNPNMPDADKLLYKGLQMVSIHTTPLSSSGSIIFKYRVDTESSWTTLFTKTSTSPDTNLVFYNFSKNMRKGFNYEFRIESTGGAKITSYSYTYQILTT